jgi:hypothetical protein
LAAPETVKIGGTYYLKDAENYLDKAPVVPKISSTPAPSPSPSTRPKVTPATTVPEDKPETDDVASGRVFPAAVIHHSSITAGQQIPVPVQYAAPQVIANQQGGVVVVPATPTSFGVVQTGATMGSDGAGNTVYHDTEFNGFVNYGSPIRAVVPAQNHRGQPYAVQVILPNPVLVPVTTTIERR